MHHSLPLQILNVIDYFYFRIYHNHLGDKSKNLLSNIFISSFGIFISSIIIFSLNLFIGRTLGPIQYGYYGLIISLSQILTIPMLAGFDTATIHGISTNSTDKHSKIISSGSIFVFALSILFSFLSIISTSSIKYFTNLPTVFIIIAIIFSFLNSQKIYFDSIIRSQHYFKFQSILKILESVILPITFFSLYFFLPVKNKITTYLIALIICYSISIIFYFIKIKSHILIKYFDKNSIIDLWKYAKFALLSSIGGLAISSVDRLIINHQLGVSQLGQYNAYYTSSVLIASQLLFIFINVFFPAAAREQNKIPLFNKLNHITALAFLPGIFIMSLISCFIIFLFGSAYSFNLGLIFLMSAYSIAIVIWDMYWWLISSYGPAGVRFTLIHGIIGNFIYLILVTILIKSLNLYAIPVSFIVAFFYIIYQIVYWQTTSIKLLEK